MNWAMPYEPVEADRRRFLRVPLACEVRYDIAGAGAGYTTSENVSRGGLSLRLSEPVETGAASMLTIGEAGGWAELKARVSWRQAERDGEYIAGFRIYHDEPDVIDVMSRLVRQAMIGKLLEPSGQPEDEGLRRLRDEAGAWAPLANAPQVA